MIHTTTILTRAATKNACIDHAPFTMKRRTERKAVPPNAIAGCAVVEMPAAVAQVGTASDPTYGLLAAKYPRILRQSYVR